MKVTICKSRMSYLVYLLDLFLLKSEALSQKSIIIHRSSFCSYSKKSLMPYENKREDHVTLKWTCVVFILARVALYIFLYYLTPCLFVLIYVLYVLYQVSRI